MIIVIHVYGDVIYVGDVQLVCLKLELLARFVIIRIKGKG
jgi:hypothetical protein